MNDIGDINQVTQSSYNFAMVGFSYLLALLGSLIALNAGERICGPLGVRKRNVLSAGLALGGIGIWSMHFTGMLALKLDMGTGTGYALLETVGSLLAALVAASLAFLFVALRPKSVARIVVAGCVLGLSVAFMHYLGIHGMRFPGYIVWDPYLFALSVLIAVVAATAALWLTFRSRQAFGRKVAAAALMGLAVSAMHYVGMEAANFICTAPAENRFIEPTDSWVVSVLNLPFITGVGAVCMILLLAYDQLAQRMENTLTRSA